MFFDYIGKVVFEEHELRSLQSLLRDYRSIISQYGFHTQCVMMNTIHKRYKGSELGDVLMTGGVVAEGSVDRALKGKHYKRGLRCLMLMYEALICGLVKG